MRHEKNKNMFYLYYIDFETYIKQIYYKINLLESRKVFF